MDIHITHFIKSTYLYQESFKVIIIHNLCYNFICNYNSDDEQRLNLHINTFLYK